MTLANEIGSSFVFRLIKEAEALQLSLVDTFIVVKDAEWDACPCCDYAAPKRPDDDPIPVEKCAWHRENKFRSGGEG